MLWNKAYSITPPALERENNFSSKNMQKMALVLMYFGRTLLEQTMKTNCTTFDTLDPEMGLFCKKGLGLASCHILCMIFFFKKRKYYSCYTLLRKVLFIKKIFIQFICKEKHGTGRNIVRNLRGICNQLYFETLVLASYVFVCRMLLCRIRT